MTNAMEIQGVTDATPPVLTLSLPREGEHLNADPVPVAGSVNDPQPGSGVNPAALVLSITDASGSVVIGPLGAGAIGYNAGDGSFSTTLPGLSEGVYTLALSASDNAGNPGGLTRSFTVDRTAPGVSILSPAPNTRLTGTEQIVTVRVLDNFSLAQTLAGQTTDITLTVAGQPVGEGLGLSTSQCTGPSATDCTVDVLINVANLPTGLQTLAVTAADPAGNITEVSQPVRLRDTDGPVVTLISPVSGGVLGGAVQVQALVESVDTAKIRYVDLFVDEGLTPVATVDWQPVQVSGSVSFVLDALALTDGPHVLTVKAFERPGRSNNVGVDSLTVTVDNTSPPGPDTLPPALAILSPTPADVLRGVAQTIQLQVGDDRPLLSAPGATLTLTYAGQTVAALNGLNPADCNVTGTFCTLSVPVTLTNLPDADPARNDGLLLVAALTDPAGNTSTASVSTSIRNNTGPDVTVLEPADGAATSGVIPVRAFIDAPVVLGKTVRYADLFVDGSPTAAQSVDFGAAGILSGSAAFTLDTTQLADGPHTLKVRAYLKPARSNKFGEDSVSVVVDNTTPPGPDIISPSAVIVIPKVGDILNQPQQLVEIAVGDNVSMSDGGTAVVEVFFAGTLVGELQGFNPTDCTLNGTSCSLLVPINIANLPDINDSKDDKIPLTVKITDVIGNVQETSVLVSVKSNVAPIVTVQNPGEGSLVSGSIPVDFRITAPQGAVRFVDLFVAGLSAPIASLDFGNGGVPDIQGRFTLDTALLPNGTNTFTVTAYLTPGRSDRVGEAKRHVTVQNTLLSASIQNVTIPGSTSVEVGETVQITVVGPPGITDLYGVLVNAQTDAAQAATLSAPIALTESDTSTGVYTGKVTVTKRWDQANRVTDLLVAAVAHFQGASLPPSTATFFLSGTDTTTSNPLSLVGPMDSALALRLTNLSQPDSKQVATTDVLELQLANAPVGLSGVDAQLMNPQASHLDSGALTGNSITLAETTPGTYSAQFTANPEFFTDGFGRSALVLQAIATGRANFSLAPASELVLSNPLSTTGGGATVVLNLFSPIAGDAVADRDIRVKGIALVTISQSVELIVANEYGAIVAGPFRGRELDADPQTGIFQKTIPGLSDGLYQVTLQTIDSAFVKSVFFSLDHQPPAIAIEGLTSGQQIHGTEHIITLTITDNAPLRADSNGDGTAVEIRFAGTTVYTQAALTAHDCHMDGEAPCVLSIPLNLANLPDHVQTVTVTVTDPAGNRGTETFSVDLRNNQAPVVTIKNPSSGVALTGTAEILASFTHPGGNKVELMDIFVDNHSQPLATVTFQPTKSSGTERFLLDTTTFSDGVHVLTVKAYTEPGRSPQVGSAAIVVTVNNATLPAADTQSPVVQILSPQPGDTLNGAVQEISLRIGDDHPLTHNDNVRLRLSFGEVVLETIALNTPAACNASGTFCTLTHSVNIANISAPNNANDGNVPLQAVLIDGGANQSTDTVVVKVKNNLGPIVQITSPVDEATVNGTLSVTVTFNAQSNVVRVADLRIDDNPTPLLSTNLGTNGAASGTLTLTFDTQLLNDGPHAVAVTVYEKANRTGDVGEANILLKINNYGDNALSPSLAVVSPANRAILTSPPATITGTAFIANELQTLEVSVAFQGENIYSASVAASTLQLNYQTHTWTTTGVPFYEPGEYTVTVHAVDREGLTSDLVSIFETGLQGGAVIKGEFTNWLGPLSASTLFAVYPNPISDTNPQVLGRVDLAAGETAFSFYDVTVPQEGQVFLVGASDTNGDGLIDFDNQTDAFAIQLNPVVLQTGDVVVGQKVPFITDILEGTVQPANGLSFDGSVSVEVYFENFLANPASVPLRGTTFLNAQGKFHLPNLVANTTYYIRVREDVDNDGFFSTPGVDRMGYIPGTQSIPTVTLNGLTTLPKPIQLQDSSFANVYFSEITSGSILVSSTQTPIAVQYAMQAFEAVTVRLTINPGADEIVLEQPGPDSLNGYVVFQVNTAALPDGNTILQAEVLCADTCVTATPINTIAVQADNNPPDIELIYPPEQ